MVSEQDMLSIAEGKWVSIPRISRIIPFGYTLSEDDPNLLIPVIFELEALEKAKQHIKRYSYRVVAQWLSQITGRYISHMGLKKRLEIEQLRRRKATTLKQWAKQLEEVRSKVEKYEQESLGASKET
jgi:cyclopropane fatty-acyl-phospholipid synthase-like methyltransferase